MMLEQRKIVLPKRRLCPHLVDELEAFQYSVTEKGSMKTGAPSGQHDDCVIALALAAWQLQDDQDGEAGRLELGVEQIVCLGGEQLVAPP